MDKPQIGSSLLEILVALFLLSVGLLGLVRLQAITLVNFQTALHHWVAINQVVSLAESVTSQTVISLEEWNQQNAAWLPEGNGWLQASATGPIIRLQWHMRGVNAGMALLTCRLGPGP